MLIGAFVRGPWATIADGTPISGEFHGKQAMVDHLIKLGDFLEFRQYQPLQFFGTVEDVAYRVVTGNLVPDHSTIAEFRVRHEDALAELFHGRAGALPAGGAGVGRGGRDRWHKGGGERRPHCQPRLRADRPRDPGGGGGDRPLRGRAQHQ